MHSVCITSQPQKPVFVLDMPSLGQLDLPSYLRFAENPQDPKSQHLYFCTKSKLYFVLLLYTQGLVGRRLYALTSVPTSTSPDLEISSSSSKGDGPSTITSQVTYPEGKYITANSNGCTGKIQEKGSDQPHIS